MGLDGFEFVEFAALETGPLEWLFESLGFVAVADHRSKAVTLYRQGGINFIVNRDRHSQAGFFAAEHGPGACGMAFRVRNAQQAYARALQLGAQPVDMATGPMELRWPAIRAIGGAALFLIDRYAPGSTIYDIDFEWRANAEGHPPGVGLTHIDHLTHNVYRGRLNHWAGFYERLFNFQEIRHFDIRGQHTGLLSRALTAPDHKIRIPLNEEGGQGGGQIDEYLMRFNGEGIQHIALATPDLCVTVDALRERGVPLMTAPPATYYEIVEDRLPGHGQPTAALQQRGILLDGTTGGERRLLLQIFSECLIGPVFFEFIQVAGDEGFGEGNFKALFESLERDQIRRGALQRPRAPDDRGASRT